jgi:alpha-beta hydrolase superfamily lysophospholipase
MKRDAVDLGEESAAGVGALERRATYLGDGEGAFLAWFHRDDSVPALDTVAVICPPLGSEYTRAHRSLRHLADRLARAGIPALRFDYPGAGDSPGGDLDPDRVGAWQAGIRTALEAAREASGLARACLIGVRFGANLAAQVAAHVDVERLVLWNPCMTGRGYVRELQALAAASAAGGGAPGPLPEGAIESAGFVFTAETLAAMRALDALEAIPGAAQRVLRAAKPLPRAAKPLLIVARDDMAEERKLGERLAALGIAHDVIRAPGWSGMMAEHQFTVVPDAALDAIVGWVREGSASRAVVPVTPGPLRPAPRDTVRFSFTARDGTTARLEERACRFGAARHLFGVLGRAAADADRPAIVIFNAGAAHHVGPNRLYVELARNLAAAGFACLRFDLESLGDSVNRQSARENYPYPTSAVDDARAAFEYLHAEHGYRRFIALGLCSGAHTVFHVGLDCAGLAIEEIVMVNPMQFYWVEGMSLDTSRRFEDMLQYRKSMRDPKRWLKLLRGDVNFRRMFELALAYPGSLARTWADGLRERLLPEGGPRLSRDLKRLFAMGRRVTLFVSEGDPGRDVLLAQAPVTARRALKGGRIRLQMIPGADHTFSRAGPRADLVARLCEHLAPRAREDAAASYGNFGPVLRRGPVPGP